MPHGTERAVKQPHGIHIVYSNFVDGLIRAGHGPREILKQARSTFDMHTQHVHVGYLNIVNKKLGDDVSLESTESCSDP